MNYRDFVLKELSTALYFLPEKVNEVEKFEHASHHPELITIGDENSGRIIVALRTYHLLLIEYSFNDHEAIMTIRSTPEERKYVYDYLEATKDGGTVFINFIEDARAETLSKLLALVTE